MLRWLKFESATVQKDSSYQKLWTDAADIFCWISRHSWTRNNLPYALQRSIFLSEAIREDQPEHNMQRSFQEFYTNIGKSLEALISKTFSCPVSTECFNSKTNFWFS